MSEFYDELAETVIELLTEFGQDVIVRQIEAGSRDASTGFVTQAPSKDTVVKGALFDFIYRTYGDTTEMKTLVNSSVKRLLLDATVEVQVRDRVIVNSKEYIILVIKEINPAGTVVLYDLMVQR